MASLKDIRSRIQSTKNTQQITRAMKMVSAAKLRRAQQAVVATRPYAVRLYNLIRRIALSQRVTHPLLGYQDQPEKLLLILVTSDRGLCGGFNNSVSRFAYEYYLEAQSRYTKVDFVFIGRKGAEFFKRKGITAAEISTNLDKKISRATAADFAGQWCNQFADGHYDEVRIIYNEFKSAIQQIPVCEKLLPVHLNHNEIGQDEEIHDVIFEPEPERVIEQLLHRHFAIHVYRCLCDSLASEHGARMNAMENATRNAQEMIRVYTLTYNKLRQASITTELTEITSGAEALKN